MKRLSSLILKGKAIDHERRHFGKSLVPIAKLP